MSPRDRDADAVEHILAGALARADSREQTNVAERDFERTVVDMARRFDWLAVHYGGNLTGRAWYDTAGFPDLLLIHPSGTVLFRELKTRGNKLSARQQQWQQRLTTSGADTAVWTPDDWPDIVAALSFGKARPS
jgi:hypothetical protein